MKKLSLITMLCCFCILGADAQNPFNCIGGVSYSPAPGGHKMYTMTTGYNCTNKLHAGAIWAIGGTTAVPATLNFYQSFQLDFWVRFDNSVGAGFGASPADGICAVFGNNINTASSLNSGGGYLGYYDIPGFPANPDFSRQGKRIKSAVPIHIDVRKFSVGSKNEKLSTKFFCLHIKSVLAVPKSHGRNYGIL